MPRESLAASRLSFRRSGLFFLSALLLCFSPAAQPSAAAASGCALSQVAFCDTFDAPSPNGAGTRSGDLDGVVWGVSRATSDDNPSQRALYNWNASQMNRCGESITVSPPRDVQICNGQLVESVSDHEAATVLAMYPRQPFDFAGRTGKIVFDVSNDTQGPHAAWPEIVITDQPVPAPFEDAPGIADYARNSFGVQLSGKCDDGWTVNSMFTTSNYQFASTPFARLGCVKSSTGASGPLNPVEIDVSPTHVDVFATDPGSAQLVQLASADVAMPLTRGLVWMEDAHYNANKFDNQANHTFAWANFGFDGPVLPRDLGFDLLDANDNGTGGGSIGFLAAAGGAYTFHLDNVHDVENASDALLEFTWWPHTRATITYSVNGNPPHTMAWPYGNAALYRSETLALPVPPGELVDGSNAFSISTTDAELGGVSIANADLILAGAGGSPATASQASP